MVKKLNRIEVEEKLKSLGLFVFTPLEFKNIFNVSTGAASVFISHNTEKGGIFNKIRNGLYSVKDADVPNYFIANKLYEPSYISLSTALSHYGIIPETVYATTSITTKTSREFNTHKGNFIYQRIKKDVFTGYGLKEIDREKVLIAEPEKALADYLYFVDLKRSLLNDRLELKKIKKYELISFVKLFKRESMLKLVDQIYVEYKKPRKIY
jgi:predicted transcriptional regulator of viral defense system